MIRIEDTLGHVWNVQEPVTIQAVYDYMQPHSDYPVVLAKINNDICDFHTIITEDVCLEWLSMQTPEANRAYQRTLIFLMVKAARNVSRNGDVRVAHSLGNALYCEWIRSTRNILSPKEVQALENEMHRIVNEEPYFMKSTISREEGMRVLQAAGRAHDSEILEQLQADTYITYYQSGNYADYFFGPLLPSFTYVQLFSLQHYAPGFLTHFPSWQQPDRLTPYEEIPKFAKVFLEAKEWGRILRCSYVNQLNRYIKQGRIGEIIELAEALHEKKEAQIADLIVGQKPAIKLVLIAGPSSAGKTTFTKRLCTQLRVNNVMPLMISLDDYFLNRKDTPRLADGSYDFESVRALDIDLFNEQLENLMEGKPVCLSRFNFETGTRYFDEEPIQLEKNAIIVVEGLHALNDTLSSVVPRYEKFKIYLGALTQLAINDHNRISTSDMRLIRRIVRDYQFRGNDASRTFSMWESVRRGEETYIFPFQEDADIIFNSALIYELCVLKSKVLPLLEEITSDDPHYAMARHLIRFLSPFIAIDASYVPQRSLLREFVGD